LRASSCWVHRNTSRAARICLPLGTITCQR
jgi:hypothetical protein